MASVFTQPGSPTDYAFFALRVRYESAEQTTGAIGFAKDAISQIYAISSPRCALRLFAPLLAQERFLSRIVHAQPPGGQGIDDGGPPGND